jgi:hypothetical protein
LSCGSQSEMNPSFSFLVIWIRRDSAMSSRGSLTCRRVFWCSRIMAEDPAAMIECSRANYASESGRRWLCFPTAAGGLTIHGSISSEESGKVYRTRTSLARSSRLPVLRTFQLEKTILTTYQLRGDAAESVVRAASD